MLIVDLGAEHPVEKLVIRWQGAPATKYALYTFNDSHSHTTINEVKKLFDKNKVKDKHLIFRGSPNPPQRVEDILRQNRSPLDFEQDNQVQSAWQRTNSYYATQPFSRIFTNNLSEVFQLQVGSTPEKVRFIALKGMDNQMTYSISELEVYAYAPQRQQIDYARLVDHYAAVYLLYRTTSNGTLLDPEIDRGAGKQYYLAEVVHQNNLQRQTHPQLRLPEGAQLQDFDWTPFKVRPGGALGNHLKIIAGVDPFVVYDLDLNSDSGALVELTRQATDIGQRWGGGTLGTIRGGSTVQYDKDKEQYLMFFHSQVLKPAALQVGPRMMQRHAATSYMGALTFVETNFQHQPGYALHAVTPEPLVLRDWYLYYDDFAGMGPQAGGLTVHPDGADNGMFSAAGFVANPSTSPNSAMPMRSSSKWSVCAIPKSFPMKPSMCTSSSALSMPPATSR